MNCKHCGVLNSDDAVFCKGCGKRLDEELVCPSCGKKLDEDSAFCIYCGQPVKKIQTTVVETPKAQAPAAEAPKAQPAEQKPIRAGTAKKVLNYVATSAVLATAAFSLIFVFLMGFTGVTQVYYGSSMKVSTDLYYYFGEGYKQVSDAIDYSSSANAFFKASLYMPVIFGTLISAVTLIVVLISSISAIVFSIRHLLGKEEDTGAGFALTAFTAFVTGSLLLLALNNNHQTIEGLVTSYSLNGATIAGIVLSSISAAAYLGCTIAMRGRELAKVDVIIKTVLSLASLVFVIIVLALASLPAFGIRSDELEYGDKINVGFKLLMTVLGALCSSDTVLTQVDNAGLVLAFAIITCLFLAAFAIVAARLFVKNIEGATKNEKNNSLAISIVMTVFALVYFVFSIVTAEQFLVAAEEAGGAILMGEASDEIAFTYAVPIVMFVFSLITLGINIAQACLINKFIKKPAPANEAQKSA